MPVRSYFKGHGEKVMRQLVKEYGPKDGKRSFYAIANKQRKQRKRNGPNDDRYTGKVPVASPSPSPRNGPNDDQFTGMVAVAAPKPAKPRPHRATGRLPKRRNRPSAHRYFL